MVQGEFPDGVPAKRHLRPPNTSDVQVQVLRGKLEPRRVLYEAEVPILFTTIGVDGRELLAYLADEERDGLWYVLTAASAATIDDLQHGRISTREALTSGWMWLARTDAEEVVSGAWAITEHEIPPDHLPRPGTPLLAEHRAAFRMRATGPELIPGSVPASVLEHMGGAARRALKKLVDHISGSTTSGRPPASHRELYDLRVQRIGFGSFELSYAAPQQGLFDRELLATAVQKLDAIVRWAASSEESPAPWYDEAEREAMLRAAAELAPPSSGPIVAIELGGDWLRRGMVRLDRSARKNVRMELRNSPTAETVESVSGRIGEVDRDALSLTLRDLEKGEELRASFDEELLDDVLLFFTEDQRVRVAGTRVAGKLHVGLIAAEMRASSAEGEGSL